MRDGFFTSVPYSANQKYNLKMRKSEKKCMFISTKIAEDGNTREQKATNTGLFQMCITDISKPEYALRFWAEPIRYLPEV